MFSNVECFVISYNGNARLEASKVASSGLDESNVKFGIISKCVIADAVTID